MDRVKKTKILSFYLTAFMINNRVVCDPHVVNSSHLLHVLKSVRECLVLLVLQQELLKLNGLDQ